ncbi:MAG: ATP-binding protein [Bacteroidales bacterium]|nr:ATP-binding protein [Bacteroidales bacterium]MCM1416041.1 ATP-binding protein [bacterium]MCM1424189.1 ATP-binding protein [bacterium]
MQIDNKTTGITFDKRSQKQIEIRGGEKIERAVKSLSQFGLITFSREQYFKSSSYTIHFFKPTENIRNQYNMGNEILILCCTDGMRDFKSRTKDFIDYILTTREEFKNRLDRITCILIDENADITSIVKTDRRENPDARLIVPFCLDELQKDIDENEFHNRMRDFLYQRDLFGIASPLNNDTLFFGKDRTNMISELYGKYRQGEQGGLFGLRRIGKTSVLNLLRARIEANKGVAIYFDCSQYHHQRWNEFLKSIIIELDKKYSYDVQFEEQKHLSEDFELRDLSKFYSETSAVKDFESDIESLYHALKDTRILLIFDEIESISYTTSPSEHWKRDNDSLFFWQALRSIIQTHSEFFSFIIAGVNPKCVEISMINEYDNPIFGIFRPIYMSLFDYGDVKSMVSSIGGRLGLSFEEEVYAKLVSDYGGHPFLTRQVCSKINCDLLERKVLRPTTVSKYSYEKNAQDYRMNMTGVIEQILIVLQTYYPEEFKLLKTLALDGQKAFAKEIIGGEKEIQHLKGYCLIEKDDGDYFIRIKSIEEYLKTQFLYDKTLTSQADKRARLNIRRDNVECKLRDIIFYNMQGKFGKKAKEQLLTYISGTTPDRTQDRKMRDINFKSAMKELYFSQLKHIILKNWKDYASIFNDKVKFEQFFDLINASRGSGDHSRELDDEEEALYNIAFNYFETILKDYE